MSHVNIGRFQLLYWPRWCLAFWRGPRRFPVYAWIVYVWPIEVRCFKRATRQAR